ncbi:UbiA family prenyltransferase [Tateyamaria sp. syn59]|uniref:UbiA prenyltransferase family protein n=1 Tax=Tateyamaria sp. syn59 TaxID=2576942 RepID=UPI001676409B|nr:UbiA family prenyltransferase [Tateyamaria sp. syn59]
MNNTDTILGMLLSTGRWPVSAIAGVAAALAAVGSGDVSSSKLISLFLGMWLVTMSGFVWNDIYDADMDRQAGKMRPIASGELSPQFAAFATVVACLFALVLTLSTFGASATLVLICTMAALLLYSPFGRVHPLVKPIWVGALCMSPFALSSVALDLAPDATILGLGFLFIVTRELLIDLQDAESDRDWGVWTIDQLLDPKFLEYTCWGALVLIPTLGALMASGIWSTALLTASALANAIAFKIYLAEPGRGLLLTRLGMLFAVVAISISLS